MKKNNNSIINQQKICCGVTECKYNDTEVECCTLKEIKVSCNCKCANCKDDTICASFKCREKED